MVTADIVVIGGGPAGVAAAVSASESGCSVVVVDEAHAPGGQIWRGGAASRSGRSWLRRLAVSGAEFLPETSIIDAPAPLLLAAERDGAPLALRARRAVILATGARELFLPFPGWTLPGVVGAGGAQALLKSGWSVRGARVVVAGSGPLLLVAAAALRSAGARIEAVAEQAPAVRVRRFAASLWRTPSRLMAGARYRSTFGRGRYLTGSWVTRAEGDERVRSVRIAGDHERDIACDVLCVGYGLTGSTELARLMGCAVSSRGVAVDPMQQTSVPHVYCAGEAVMIGGVDAALVQGRIAGLAAAGREDDARRWFRARARQAAFAARLRAAFALRPETVRLAADDTIVCRCEDVRWSEIAQCESAREARLHHRVGMGACQGRVCGAALRHVRGWADGAVRPPIVPASINTLIHVAPPDDEHAEE